MFAQAILISYCIYTYNINLFAIFFSKGIFYLKKHAHLHRQTYTILPSIDFAYLLFPLITRYLNRVLWICNFNRTGIHQIQYGKRRYGKELLLGSSADSDWNQILHIFRRLQGRPLKNLNYICSSNDSLVRAARSAKSPSSFPFA